MINYRAIEEAETILDHKIAETTDPVAVACGKLKRGIVRGWAIWIAEHADQPEVVHQAGARIVGDLIVELAINSDATREDGTKLTSAEHAAVITHEVLSRVDHGIKWDMAGRTGSSVLIEMQLNVPGDG